MQNREDFGAQLDFTQNVKTLVDKIVTNNAGIVRSSLDFNYQKQRMLEKDCKVRYKESENLDRLKMEFANQNELPDIDELAEGNGDFK